MPRPNRLRELRKAARLTLKDLSQRTGKAFQTIAEYETHKQEMPEDFLTKAAAIFGISPEHLYTEGEASTRVALAEPPPPYRTATDQTLEWLIGKMAWEEVDQLAKDAVDQRKREVAMKLLEIAERCAKQQDRNL